jgi:hypothetical protein
MYLWGFGVFRAVVRDFQGQGKTSNELNSIQGILWPDTCSHLPFVVK